VPEFSLRNLRVREDAGLVAPYRIEQLLELIEQELLRRREDRARERFQVRFELPTAEAAIEEANHLATQLLSQTGLPTKAEQALGIGFHEAVDNAAVHGNQREAERKIWVVFLADAELVTFIIEDEGQGFDTAAYLSRDAGGRVVARARERNDAGRPGGMGIMLMLRCTDDLEYNAKGNQVRLTKRRSA
jgi:serine/threonine-protein kinase RsbW